MRTEREKMLAGELYVATDPELVAMRRHAREMTRAFNQADEREGMTILKRLFGAMGGGTFIEPPFYCDYGVHIRVGERFYMNFGCVILDAALVEVGDDVQCGPYVQIYAATHPLLAAERIQGPELAKPVRIGDNVWLGGGAIICPGVTVGANSTVAAGAVVTNDVPPNVLVGGNPARVIRALG